MTPIDRLRFIRDLSAVVVPSTCKLVLYHLLARANKDGWANPGLDSISADTGLGHRAIRQAINRLAQAGLLTKRRRYKAANHYQLTFEAYQAMVGELVATASLDLRDRN